VTEQADWNPAQLPSGRHGLPREYVAASQRARLLSAAVLTAGESGYAGMTVSAVIGKAGVSRKTFYEFFRDREDLFLAAFDSLATAALDGAREAFGRGDSWPKQLRSLLAAGLGTLAERPDAARLGFVEVLAAGPTALARREAAMRAFAEFLSPGFDAAREQADADIPGLMPEAIAGALCEIVYTRVLQGRTAELPGLLGELLFCALAPFLGPSAAAEHAAASGPEPR
jgi:AcrR family transcriptional regulator